MWTSLCSDKWEGIWFDVHCKINCLKKNWIFLALTLFCTFVWTRLIFLYSILTLTARIIHSNMLWGENMELGNQNQMRNQIGISPFSRIQSSRDSRISLPFYSKSQLLVRSKAGNLYNSYTTCILLESRQVRRQNASKTRERSPCPTYLPI